MPCYTAQIGVRYTVKTHRSRCTNPKCGRQYRHEQTGSQTCSDACRQAVYRQRKADNEAEAEALAQFAVEAARQEQMRKATAHALQLRSKRREAAFEEERERYQQAAQEDAEAERSRPRTAPPVDNSTVTISADHARYAGLMTPIPSKMKPGYL